MKFTVSSSALLSLLATTGKVISNKNTLPILDYFLMELNGNELKVTTSHEELRAIGREKRLTPYRVPVAYNGLPSAPQAMASLL